MSIDPLSVPKHESITTIEMIAAPAPPSSGMRLAASAAMSGVAAISGRGTR
ncbi:hypothetical protein D3C83_185900 [compost metagenome]